MAADGRRSARSELARRLESEQVFELPVREALSFPSTSLTDDLMAYASATQSTTGSTTDPTTATASAVPTGAIDTAVAEAQNSSTQQNGAVAQNVNSPNSDAFASTSS